VTLKSKDRKTLVFDRKLGIRKVEENLVEMRFFGKLRFGSDKRAQNLRLRILLLKIFGFFTPGKAQKVWHKSSNRFISLVLNNS
jgi:hypothetical protein